MSMIATHIFRSTGDAYDACQCDESIKRGDVLVIESEGVIGVADTWPIAVTVVNGNLHSLEEGATADAWALATAARHIDYVATAKRLLDGCAAALDEAMRRGFPLRAEEGR